MIERVTMAEGTEDKEQIRHPVVKKLDWEGRETFVPMGVKSPEEETGETKSWEVPKIEVNQDTGRGIFRGEYVAVKGSGEIDKVYENIDEDPEYRLLEQKAWKAAESDPEVIEAKTKLNGGQLSDEQFLRVWHKVFYREYLNSIGTFAESRPKKARAYAYQWEEFVRQNPEVKSMNTDQLIEWFTKHPEYPTGIANTYMVGGYISQIRNLNQGAAFTTEGETGPAGPGQPPVEAGVGGKGQPPQEPPPAPPGAEASRPEEETNRQILGVLGALSTTLERITTATADGQKVVGQALDNLSRALGGLARERIQLPNEEEAHLKGLTLEQAQVQALRERIAEFERVGSEFPSNNYSFLLDAIQRQASPEIADKLIKELNARYALHNGALTLDRVNLEGYTNFMGSQPLEFFDYIAQVEGVEKAIELFDKNLVGVFSATELHKEEKDAKDVKKDAKDGQGGAVKITRKEKLSFSKDLRYYQNEFTKETLKFLLTPLYQRGELPDLNEAIENVFKESDELITKIEEEIRGLSGAQKEKVMALRKQAETAVNLAEKMYRVTGVAAACDMPEFNRDDGSIKIPYKKGYTKRADGVWKEALLVEKRKIGGEEEEVSEVVLIDGDESEAIREAISQNKKLEEDRISIKRGSGDFALWRDMWLYPYCEWLERGRLELRPYVRTGMIDFITLRTLPRLPSKIKETQGSLYLRAARKEPVAMTPEGIKIAPGEMKMVQLLERVRTKQWDTGHWGTWLGQLRQTEQNRATLEARKGYLYQPSEANIQALAQEGFENFKDKDFERRLIFDDLYRGSIKYNTSEEMVKKYHGEKAQKWTNDLRDLVLLRAVRSATLTDEQVQAIKTDPKLQPRWQKVFIEVSKEYGLPILSEAGAAFVSTFFRQLYQLVQVR